jgi:serpin B
MHRLVRRSTAGVLAVSIALAGCGTAGPTASPGSTSAPPPATPPPLETPPSTPAPDTSTWQPAGELALARAGAHAVLLGDGRVLVVGSDNICTPGGAWDESVQAEVLDPATATWTATDSLNAPRTDFAALALPDGRALVVGGLTAAEPEDGPFGAYSSTKLYDPEDGRWSSAGVLDAARTEPAAAVLPDGRVVVAGGAYVDDEEIRVLASAEVFDPETATWSPTGDLATARRDARAVTLADGRVLVVGGSSKGRRLYVEYTPVASAEVYDPAAGTWSPAGTLAAPRSDFSLVALPDGGALVAGGIVGDEMTAAAERWDPSGGTWSATGSMRSPAANRSAVLLGDGRVLVAGGIGAAGAGTGGQVAGTPVVVLADTEQGTPAIAAAELYDPATGAWAAATPLPEAREGGSFVTLTDRTVLLVGGDGGYVGEPSAPWCPPPIAAAVRYVPGNLADFPEVTAPPAATAVARSDAPRAAAKPAQAKRVATSITAFGVDLYRRMLKDGTLDPKANAVLSPTSIVLALGMARAGAAGETATQMDDVLHVGGWPALGAGLNALEQALASRDATYTDDTGQPHELALRIANAAFAQRDWAILATFLDRIAATFGSGLRLVDYIDDTEGARRTINAWVGKRTQGRIPELLEPGTVTRDGRLFLVNAIYLKASWANPFAASATRSRAFTRPNGSVVKVPTMAQQDTIPLAAGAGWTATELRYEGGDWRTPLAMTLILPDDLRSFEKALSARQLATVVRKLDTARDHLGDPVACTTSGEITCCHHPYDVRLFLPRFGIESKADLVPDLKALGMTLASDPLAADFSGINAPSELFIAKVIHQANIDVDEKGTEAAAATAVGMETTGGCGPTTPYRIIDVRLNRPFLFLLRDVETGAILFMGRVVDPSAK